METTIKKKRQHTQHNHSALDKAKAVLSVWTERRKVSEICRELSIQWNILTVWQNRAMEGMLQALEPRVNLHKGPALSPKLQQMLNRRQQTIARTGPPETRLEEKLTKIEANRATKPRQPQTSTKKTARKK